MKGEKKDVPLRRVGNPQHNNVAYKRGVHRHVNADISFRRSSLGGKAADTMHHKNWGI